MVFCGLATIYLCGGWRGARAAFRKSLAKGAVMAAPMDSDLIETIKPPAMPVVSDNPLSPFGGISPVIPSPLEGEGKGEGWIYDVPGMARDFPFFFRHPLRGGQGACTPFPGKGSPAPWNPACENHSSQGGSRAVRALSGVKGFGATLQTP